MPAEFYSGIMEQSAANYNRLARPSPCKMKQTWFSMETSRVWSASIPVLPELH